MKAGRRHGEGARSKAVSRRNAGRRQPVRKKVGMRQAVRRKVVKRKAGRGQEEGGRRKTGR